MIATTSNFKSIFLRLAQVDHFFGIFILGLFFMPFIAVPTAVVPFEVPRVWFVLIWIYLLTLTHTFGMIFQQRKLQQVHASLFALLALLFLWGLAASILGSDIRKSIFGNFYRIDGLLTFFSLMLLAYLLAQRWRNRWNAIVASCVTFAATLVSVQLLHTGLKFHLWGDNSAYTFGNANFLAGYVLVALPFSFYCYLQSKHRKRTYILLAILVQMIAMISTQSWGAVLGIGVIVLVAIQQYFRLRGWNLIGLALVAILFASVGLFVREIKSPIVQYDQTEGRSRIFGKASVAVSKRPLIGWGWANFDHAFDAVDWKVHIPQDAYVDKAHSHIVEMVVTTGVLGGLLYVFFLIKLLRTVDRSTVWGSVLFLTITLYIFHTQTNVISIAEEVLFWIAVGNVGRLQANSAAGKLRKK